MTPPPTTTAQNPAAPAYGGGVYVYRATFKKERGAVIYGSDGGENSNTASTGSTAEVYKYDAVDGIVNVKTREAIAGAGETLSAVYDTGTEDYISLGAWDE